MRRQRTSRRPTQWGKILLVSAIAFGGMTVANAHDEDNDSKDRITRTYDLTGFDAIDISGVYDVEVSVGKDFSIRLEGREKEMEYAEVELDGNTLELGKRKRKKSWSFNNTTKSINAYITMPDLNELNVSGVTDADITGVDAGSFDLHVSGVADVNISGRCGSLDAHISGVSDVDAEGLVCEHGDVSLSGVGDMDVYTSKSIDVSVHGVGSVTVHGKPESVEKSVSKYTASLTIK